MPPAVAVKNQLVETIGFLHESEIILLLEIAKRFIPDDVATLEDILDIQQADEEFALGEYVSHDKIDWKQITQPRFGGTNCHGGVFINMFF